VRTLSYTILSVTRQRLLQNLPLNRADSSHRTAELDRCRLLVDLLGVKWAMVAQARANTPSGTVGLSR
jgi:hypothetical protein